MHTATKPPRGLPRATPIVVGVCARDKKAHAKPMQAILARLPKIFEVVIFGDKMLFDEPPEKWPLCDCLMAFYSSGFPLAKAEEYVRLRKPYCVNDLSVEHLLLDRRHFYQRLVEADINVPRHFVVSRDKPGPPPNLIETDEYVELDGKRICKPFVEKPVDAEDHNVYIYYPTHMGGGSKRLFRKVGNQSSRFYPDVSTVRREGSFIYEEFIMTQGTDIKIYAVGPMYAHAEARKSPVLDGVVQRDDSGKEVRYPIMLNKLEKNLARKVVQAFKLNVCGFDLLRTSKTSYICDVNGWSFVKKSHKYYDDCSALLARIMLANVAPHLLSTLAKPPRRRVVPLNSHVRRSIGSKQTEELRCVVAVVRHGDRTPKQKMKMKVTHPAFLGLVAKYGSGNVRKEVKLKAPKQLQDVLEIAKRLLAEKEGSGLGQSSGDEAELSADRLKQIVHVLERGGAILGINRKVQIKPTKWAKRRRRAEAREVPPIRSELQLRPEDNPSLAAEPAISLNGLASALTVPPRHPFMYLTADSSAEGKAAATEADAAAAAEAAAAAPTAAASTTVTCDIEEDVVTEAKLVLKWGGTLTVAGRVQAHNLGTMFRESMYPGESLGLLRLHSTYRHDLKIYASDEGRVQMTAAAFAKSFLCLEGRLTPILASLVRFTNTSELLDNPGNARATMDVVKQRLHKALAARRSFGYSERAGSVVSVDSTASLDSLRRGHRGSMPDALEPPAPASPPTVAVRATGYSDRMAGAPSPPGLSAAISASKPLRHLGPAPLGRVSSTVSVNSTASTAVPSAVPATRKEEEDVMPMLAAIDPDLLQAVAPTESISLLRSLMTIGNVPRRTLRRLHTLCKNLAMFLRQLVFEGGLGDRLACNNESLLLMYERWAKLTADFYNVRKDKFDLSKVPDIYDCIKYDCLHNPFVHSANTRELFKLAKAYADLVIPQEYGITMEDKASIAGNICHHLFRKLRFDFLSARGSKPRRRKDSSDTTTTASSARESEAGLAAGAGAGAGAGVGAGAGAGGADVPAGPRSPTPSAKARPVSPRPTVLPAGDTASVTSAGGSVTDEGCETSGGAVSPARPGKERSGSVASTPGTKKKRRRRRSKFAEAVTSLAGSVSDDAGYTDIKSPLRHVRTRLYFTSESHVHSLVNAFTVLAKTNERTKNFLSHEAAQVLSAVPELDYLTHVVFRMYENFKVPVEDPSRYRVEVLFSPGCATSPFDEPTRSAFTAKLAAAAGGHPAKSTMETPALNRTRASSLGSAMAPEMANSCGNGDDTAMPGPHVPLPSVDDPAGAGLAGLSHAVPATPLLPVRTTLTLEELEELLQVCISVGEQGQQSDDDDDDDADDGDGDGDGGDTSGDTDAEGDGEPDDCTDTDGVGVDDVDLSMHSA